MWLASVTYVLLLFNVGKIEGEKGRLGRCDGLAALIGGVLISNDLSLFERLKSRDAG